MSTTCPNCNHPIRKGAKYCGFCGTNLTSPVDVKSGASPGKQDKTGTSQNSKGQEQSKPKRIKTSQVVTIIAIILLFLLVILAIICRYWVDISQMLGQLFSMLNVGSAIL